MSLFFDVAAHILRAVLAVSIGFIVILGCSGPSRAADLAALKTAISEAGFRAIYPPTSGEGAGMIYRDVTDDQGKKFRDIVCDYAFRTPPKDAAVVVASESYKEEWTGGLKVSFLPEMAGKVDLTAELTGGKLRSMKSSSTKSEREASHREKTGCSRTVAAIAWLAQTVNWSQPAGLILLCLNPQVLTRSFINSISQTILKPIWTWLFRNWPSSTPISTIRQRATIYSKSLRRRADLSLAGMPSNSTFFQILARQSEYAGANGVVYAYFWCFSYCMHWIDGQRSHRLRRRPCPERFGASRKISPRRAVNIQKSRAGPL